MRILITDPVDDPCRRVLQKEGFDVDLKPDIPHELLRTIICECDALIVRSGTRVRSKIIESVPKLRVLGRAGAGDDNINVDAATPRGVIVMNTPGGSAISVAEHALSARWDTNIAGIAMGRLEAGENALAIQSVDGDLHAHVLKETAELDGVFDAKVVGL